MYKKYQDHIEARGNVLDSKLGITDPLPPKSLVSLNLLMSIDRKCTINRNMSWVSKKCLFVVTVLLRANSICLQVRLFLSCSYIET